MPLGTSICFCQKVLHVSPRVDSPLGEIDILSCSTAGGGRSGIIAGRYALLPLGKPLQPHDRLLHPSAAVPTRDAGT